MHCSRWDWGAECWVVVWCNIKTFTSFTTPNSSLLPVQSLIKPQKWNIARDWSFREPPFGVNHLSATEMRVTDTSSFYIFYFAKYFFALDGTTVFIRAIRAGCQYIFLNSDQFWLTSNLVWLQFWFFFIQSWFIRGYVNYNFCFANIWRKFTVCFWFTQNNWFKRVIYVWIELHCSHCILLQSN